MVEIIEVKVRAVGNALGVILPGTMVKSAKLHEGETIFVGVVKKRSRAAALLGLAKGAEPFEREHSERD